MRKCFTARREHNLRRSPVDAFEARESIQPVPANRGRLELYAANRGYYAMSASIVIGDPLGRSYPVWAAIAAEIISGRESVTVRAMMRWIPNLRFPQ